MGSADIKQFIDIGAVCSPCDFQAEEPFIITPMIREDGRRTAEKFGIEVFGWAGDVKP